MAKKQAKDAAPPAATAVFVKPETVAPANRKGASTIDNPVGETWITCINATAANDGAMPERKVLNQAAMDRGVAYYTARTQVQAYRKWFVAGADPTQGLPRGVVSGERTHHPLSRGSASTGSPFDSSPRGSRSGARSGARFLLSRQQSF